MNPLKAGLVVLVCLLLFWLSLRTARRLIDLTIAAGYDAERRRQEDEARSRERDEARSRGEDAPR